MASNHIEFPNQDSKIFLEGPAGKIEALINLPKKTSGDGVVIICHPHPLFGGTMHNKVVYTMARAFQELGLPTVRFNFRGVEHSAGSYGEGIGETEDLLAVMDWLKLTKPSNWLCLAGFSFGSYVATRAAGIVPSVSQLVTVAPAVQSFNFSQITRPNCPWLVIQGEQDEIVPPEAVYSWAANLQPAPELIRIPDAGHFFHGKLIELRQVLIAALKDQTT